MEKLELKHFTGGYCIQVLSKISSLRSSQVISALSAFFSMMSRYMETGVATSGDIHVVAEMDADVLVSARDDIWSQVDKTGRRWVELSWFANAQRYGTGPAFGKVEKDLTTLITGLVKKHIPKDKEK